MYVHPRSSASGVRQRESPLHLVVAAYEREYLNYNQSLIDSIYTHFDGKVYITSSILVTLRNANISIDDKYEQVNLLRRLICRIV